MNIYFSYSLCLLLSSFIRCRKKVMQVLFCYLHLAVVLAETYEVADKTIGRVSWFTDFVGQLNHAHKSQPILSFVWHPLKAIKLGNVLTLRDMGKRSQCFLIKYRRWPKTKIYVTISGLWLRLLSLWLNNRIIKRCDIK